MRLIPGSGSGLKSLNGLILRTRCFADPFLRVSGKNLQMVKKLIKLKIAASKAGVEKGFIPKFSKEGN